ncbi:ubiquitin-related domain-containing protein [Pyronema omphalodes]|nr:ubiquitin-related domain-containing protein [Pyronema omphalodes]
MGQSDHDVLLEMGFDAERVKLAVAKTKGLHDAIEWLDKNSETPIEQLKGGATASSSSAAPAGDSEELNADGDIAEVTGTAASLKCSDCGALFSSADRAQFHAARTEHSNFEESTEVIKPLTEEEKKAKLEELREKLAAKRAAQAIADIASNKENERIRRKRTQEGEKMKQDLLKKKQLDEAAQARRDKIADERAKAEVKERIKRTHEERRQKAEAEKAKRAGLPVPGSSQPAPAPTAAPVTQKVAVNHSETKLQLRLPSGPPLLKTFAVDTTLFEVAAAIEEEKGFAPKSFTTAFPRKVFQQGIDFGLTLKEAGLVPNYVLIVS